MVTVSPNDQSLIDEAIADNAENFIDALQRSLSPGELVQLQTIGAFIMTGMLLDEACLLAKKNPEHFKADMEADINLKTYITFKLVCYKAKLIRVISGRAIDGNDKSAQYLLEARFPSEFKIKAYDPSEAPRENSVLEEGVRYVRENGDSMPLVNETDPSHGSKMAPGAPLAHE